MIQTNMCKSFIKLKILHFYSEHVGAIDNSRAPAQQNALFKLSVSAHEVFSNPEVRKPQQD